MAGGSLKYFAAGANVAKTVNNDHKLATTQTHHTLMGRDVIVRETTHVQWLKDPRAGNHQELIILLTERKQLQNLTSGQQKKSCIWASHS